MRDLSCLEMRRKVALSLAVFFFAGLFAASLLSAQSPAAPGAVSSVWNPDLGDGSYKNPILYADYSDPDAIRVGNDFYMVASSFDAVPGLHLLHSRDLIHWELIGHALHRQPPYDVYSKPQHGNGVWAPSIRLHDGVYYIFYPDPDYGIYMIKAPSILGPWSEPLLIKAAKGWIDPCPLWDGDGNAYLISALAASRAGLKNALVLSRMAPDGSRLLDDGAIIIDGHAQETTLEGPKIYKRHGYYYVFAPAGGVTVGYQLVYRSRSIYGPYERRVTLAQGKTVTNGPHQGAWVDTAAGEDWFLHFQDRGVFGRVVSLEPMQWGADDWPTMGVHLSAAGTGEPVESYRKPKLDAGGVLSNPADSDEFNSSALGLQWQWQANPEPNWDFPTPAVGTLRLVNVPAQVSAGGAAPAANADLNLWTLPNLLLQKFPAPAFTVTTKVTFTPRSAGDQTGLVVLGRSYSALVLRKSEAGLSLRQTTRLEADQGGTATDSAEIPVQGDTFYLRAAVDNRAMVHFFYSLDGKSYQAIGSPFQSVTGVWIGAKIGLFATGTQEHNELGYADYDWFRFDME